MLRKLVGRCIWLCLVKSIRFWEFVVYFMNKLWVNLFFKLVIEVKIILYKIDYSVKMIKLLNISYIIVLNFINMKNLGVEE